MKPEDNIFANGSEFKLEVTEDGRYFADWNGGVFEFDTRDNCLDFIQGQINEVRPPATK